MVSSGALRLNLRFRQMLNTLVDESDPDTAVGQIEHLLQTAEAIRRDGKPDWMQVTGLVHDLGKLLCFFGADGQWDVVGDTFVVGCKFSDKIIYPETFKENPDFYDEQLMTENGIYQPGCGLDNVMLSWGHDEYLYHICSKQSTRELWWWRARRRAIAEGLLSAQSLRRLSQ